jgi:IS30 family transposase
LAGNGGRRRYRAHRADREAWRRARRPQSSKLTSAPRLRQAVTEKLELRWSPQQISGWLTDTYTTRRATRSLVVRGRPRETPRTCPSLPHETAPAAPPNVSNP